MNRPNFRRMVRISKLQDRHHMVGQAFNPGGDRENTHWLPGYWFDVGNFESEEDMNSQRQRYIELLSKDKGVRE